MVVSSLELISLLCFDTSIAVVTSWFVVWYSVVALESVSKFGSFASELDSSTELDSMMVKFELVVESDD